MEHTDRCCCANQKMCSNCGYWDCECHMIICELCGSRVCHDCECLCNLSSERTTTAHNNPSTGSISQNDTLADSIEK